MNRLFSSPRWGAVWASLLLVPAPAVAQRSYMDIDAGPIQGRTTQAVFHGESGSDLGAGGQAAAGAAEADSAGTLRWRLRVDLSWIDPSGGFVVTDADGAAGAISFDGGVGAGVRAEYQLSNRLGVEFGALATANIDLAFDLSDNATGSHVGVSSFVPVTLGLNIHLTPGRPVDLYAGPLLALVHYGSVAVRTGIGTGDSPVSAEDDAGIGAIVGLDAPLGDHGWIVQANLRYIDTDMKNSSKALSSSGFNAVIFSIGLGYRF